MAELKTFVLGYTGGSGKALVKALARDKYFSSVVLIGRRIADLGLSENQDKFEQKVVDFDNIEEHVDAFRGCKTGFCLLGTTRSKSGSKGFVRVDRDYVANCAKVAKEAGCQHFVLVSSIGADKDSIFLPVRTKGEAEELVKETNFEKLSIFRPGMLLGNRQDSRPLDSFFKVLLKPLTTLFPTYMSVHFDVLAKALLFDVKSPSSAEVELYDNSTIHKLASEVRPE